MKRLRQVARALSPDTSEQAIIAALAIAAFAALVREDLAHGPYAMIDSAAMFLVVGSVCYAAGWFMGSLSRRK